MAYWIIAATIAGLLGYWVATRYGVDGRAGFLLALAFSTLFGTGLVEKVVRYEPTVQWALVAFGFLVCLTFLVLQDRKTSVALVKVGALTFAVSVVFQQIDPTEMGLNRAETALVRAADAAAEPVAGVGDLLEQAARDSMQYRESGGSNPTPTKRVHHVYRARASQEAPAEQAVPSTWAVMASSEAEAASEEPFSTPDSGAAESFSDAGTQTDLAAGPDVEAETNLPSQR